MFSKEVTAKFQQLVGKDLKNVDQAKRDLKELILSQDHTTLKNIAADLRIGINAGNNNAWFAWVLEIINDHFDMETSNVK